MSDPQKVKPKLKNLSSKQKKVLQAVLDAHEDVLDAEDAGDRAKLQAAERKRAEATDKADDLGVAKVLGLRSVKELWGYDHLKLAVQTFESRLTVLRVAAKAAGKYKFRRPVAGRWTSANISVMPGEVWSLTLFDDSPVEDYADHGFTHSEWLSRDLPTDPGGQRGYIAGFIRELEMGRIPRTFVHVGGAKFK